MTKQEEAREAGAVTFHWAADSEVDGGSFERDAISGLKADCYPLQLFYRTKAPNTEEAGCGT